MLKLHAPSCSPPFLQSTPVNLYRRHRRSIALLALLAMMALALVPTVSRALSLNRGAPTAADLCGGDAAGNKAKPHASLQACALCAVAAHAAGPVPPLQGLIAPSGAYALPVQFFSAPRLPFAWHAAQPRAPPVHA